MNYTAINGLFTEGTIYNMEFKANHAFKMYEMHKNNDNMKEAALFYNDYVKYTRKLSRMERHNLHVMKRSLLD